MWGVPGAGGWPRGNPPTHRRPQFHRWDLALGRCQSRQVWVQQTPSFPGGDLISCERFLLLQGLLRIRFLFLNEVQDRVSTAEGAGRTLSNSMPLGRWLGLPEPYDATLHRALGRMCGLPVRAPGARHKPPQLALKSLPQSWKGPPPSHQGREPEVPPCRDTAQAVAESPALGWDPSVSVYMPLGRSP